MKKKTKMCIRDSCWDNPIIASANSKYLERDLCGMLDKYSRDADIAAVWIWAEQRTEASWDIFCLLYTSIRCV